VIQGRTDKGLAYAPAAVSLVDHDVVDEGTRARRRFSSLPAAMPNRSEC
jgi:hypothetical protein